MHFIYHKHFNRLLTYLIYFSELRDAFNIFDKDGDGSITTDELHTVMMSLRQSASADDIREMIKQVDIDGNQSAASHQGHVMALVHLIYLYIYEYILFCSAMYIYSCLHEKQIKICNQFCNAKSCTVIQKLASEIRSILLQDHLFSLF